VQAENLVVTIFDYFVIVVVGISMLFGLVRGAVREVFALVSWVLAFIVAKEYSVQLNLWMEHFVSNPSLRLLSAFAILFVAMLIVLGLIGYFLSALMKKIGLGSLDKSLGALIGLVRGVVVMLVLVILGGLTPLPQQNDWRHALTSRWFESLAHSVKPWLPDAMAKRLHFGPTNNNSTAG
jgi:membrane protein required for colicin V production